MTPPHEDPAIEPEPRIAADWESLWLESKARQARLMAQLREAMAETEFYREGWIEALHKEGTT